MSYLRGNLWNVTGEILWPELVAKTRQFFSPWARPRKLNRAGVKLQDL
jgi:hypothetical protein